MLRAIAAILVVFQHALELGSKYGGNSWLFQSFQFSAFGRSGVDIFFVISGFVMVISSRNKIGKPGNFINFLVRRIIRIVPIYWFYTTAAVCILICFPQIFQNLKFDFMHTLASYFFLPYPNSMAVNRPVLHMGWTISYEMYFYLIFGCFLSTSLPRLLNLIAALFTFSWLISFAIEAKHPLFLMFTDCVMLEFIMGCYIGYLYLRTNTLPHALCWILVIAGTTVTLWFSMNSPDDAWPRFITCGLPAAAMVAGLANFEKNNRLRTPTIFIPLGDSSYSLYLIHFFTLPIIGKIGNAVGLAMYSLDGLILLAVVLSVVAGHISYLFLEKPVTDYLNTKYSKRVQHKKQIVHSVKD